MFFETLKSFFLAAVGGILFYWLEIPLAWMLGPLSFTAVFSHFGRNRLLFSVRIRNSALVVLGYIIGKAFTTDAARQILSQLPVMLIVTVFILLLSLLCGYIMHRQLGISFSTGMLGSVPGGFSQMVLMSEEIDDADVSVVSFMHTVRLIAVLFLVPFLAAKAAGTSSSIQAVVNSTSAYLWKTVPIEAIPLLAFSLLTALVLDKFNWPTPFLMGPILGAAIMALSGVSCPPIPGWLTILCQIAVGAYMGVKIELANLGNWRIMLVYTLLGVLVVIVASLAIGHLLSNYYGFSDVTAFLSMAPGGIAEMSVTGLAMNADLSVIASYQMFRLFFILLMTPFLFRRIIKL